MPDSNPNSRFDKPVVIIGGGGHAKVLIDALQSIPANIVAVAEVADYRGTPDLLGVPIISEDELTDTFPAGKVLLVNGLGSVGSMHLREKIYRRWKDLGYKFAIVQHPSAVVSVHAQLHEGCQILANTLIQVDASIGENSIINNGAQIDHDCRVGRNCHIAPGVVLSGSVRIGDAVHVGTGSSVIQGISVGDSSLIAAGAVVTKDVGTGQKVFGVPAKTK